MNSQDEIVFVVDDDIRVREAIGELLESMGWRAETFAAAADYIAFAKPDLPACLILDVELPDINGLDLQRQIADGDDPPIVFITGHGDIRSSVRAIRHGAVDFLTKPFSDVDLLAAIRTAIAQDRERRTERAELALLRQRYGNLTQRERDVLPLVVSGILNKQAAAELGISEVTLQVHKRNVMQKMGTASLAELVRIAEKLQIPGAHSRRSGGLRISNPKPLVAIVDDDPRLLESLEELLESAGHAVRTFSSAQTLLGSNALPEIVCLITDIGMPGMDGFELQRLVRERRPDLPVILITGRHELAELPQAKYSRLFRKPFDGRALLAAIGDALTEKDGPRGA